MVGEERTQGHNEENGDETRNIDVSGQLWKRTKLSRKWERHHIRLSESQLIYSQREIEADASQRRNTKSIRLENASITESQIDNKSAAFCIQPRNSKRHYYFNADNEESRQTWLEAIYLARNTGTKLGETSEACVIQ